jgi:iron(III) transport system permease protein
MIIIRNCIRDPRTRPMNRRSLLAAVPALAAAMLARPRRPSAQAQAPAADAAGLTVYNAQHVSLARAWAEAFTRETGIRVTMRNGSDTEMGNQIVQEGAASPADVFLTENSPAMTLVQNAALFAPVEAPTLALVPAQFRPAGGRWIGIAARSTVFAYNRTKLTADRLPRSLLDLADAAWQGRWGASPSGADFQAIVSALLELRGEAATLAWLRAMKRNAVIYRGNGNVMRAVNAGQIDGGVIYHYYFYADRARTGENSGNTELHYFRNQDPGAFVSVSGGGVLASSRHAAQAQAFVRWIVGPGGQGILRDGDSFEYAIATGAASNLALTPLGFVAWAMLRLGGAGTLELIVRPRVAELLADTALLVLAAVPLSAALAVALGWLTERAALPGARLWSALMVAPLAVPAFVQAYAWVGLFPGLHGPAAAIMVSVLAYFPFLYLPVAATLRRLDPALEEAAAALGLPPWRVFGRVVLPQLRLALCGGGLLVGAHLLAEYGLFATIRFDTFTTAIFDQFQSSYSGTGAHALAGVLVVCCLALLWLEAVLRGRARYAAVGAGVPRRAARVRLGPWLPLALLLPAATALLALGVPLVTLARWLAIGGAAVWRADELGPALQQTLLLALGGAALATLMAWLSIRAPGRLQRVLEGGSYVAGALPGVVIALALVAFTVGLPIYQTAVTALIAYVLLFLPRALVSLRASVAQAPVELEQAAELLGRPPLRALWAVTIPLAAPGIAAGMALVGLGITTELTATQMLAPTGWQTLATGFWAYSSEVDYAGAAPYALCMVLLSLPLTWLLHVQSQRAVGR